MRRQRVFDQLNLTQLKQPAFQLRAKVETPEIVRSDLEETNKITEQAHYWSTVKIDFDTANLGSTPL